MALFVDCGPGKGPTDIDTWLSVNEVFAFVNYQCVNRGYTGGYSPNNGKSL